jgi:hypothetical protein
MAKILVYTPFEFIRHDCYDVDGWIKKIAAALENPDELPNGYNLRRVVTIRAVNNKQRLMETYVAILDKYEDDTPIGTSYYSKRTVNDVQYKKELSLLQLKQALQAHLIDPQFFFLGFHVWCFDKDCLEDEHTNPVFNTEKSLTLLNRQIIQL